MLLPGASPACLQSPPPTTTSKPSLGTEIICSRDGGLAGGSSSAVSRLSPPQGGIVAHGLDCDHIDVPFQPFCADTSPTPPSPSITTYSLKRLLFVSSEDFCRYFKLNSNRAFKVKIARKFRHFWKILSNPGLLYTCIQAITLIYMYQSRNHIS